MTPTLISVPWLRRVVGLLGVSLPLVLVIIAGERESISAYYHSPARDVFVGWLVAIAVCLAAYRGFDAADAWCARVAAAGLLVLTFSPTGAGMAGKAHLAGALVFFGASAALCWRFGMGSQPKTFRALSAGIVASIAWAVVAGVTGGSIFAPEALAIVLFGAAWTLKGRWLERQATSPSPSLGKPRGEPI